MRSPLFVQFILNLRFLVELLIKPVKIVGAFRVEKSIVTGSKLLFTFIEFC